MKHLFDKMEYLNSRAGDPSPNSKHTGSQIMKVIKYV